MMKIKVLVAHPGKQHSYRLVSALERDTRFDVKYGTTVYYDKNSKRMELLKRIIPKKYQQKLTSRYNEDLSDDKVITLYPLGGLIEIFLARVDSTTKIYRKWHSFVTYLFGRKISKIAVKEKVDILICYDTNAAEAFSGVKESNPNIICILDAAAANRTYMKKVYINDIDNNKVFSDKLYREVHHILNEKSQKYYQKEVKYSDYVLVASTFVRDTYKYVGIDESNILLAPYGVELDKFKSKTQNIDMSVGKLNFVYVGGTKQIKGISYLLEAFEQLEDSNIHLTVVGTYNLSEEFKKKLKGKVTFTGFISHDKLPDLLNKMDVFIFPSLGDGMGLSVIEALSCGLPVICSENTGAKDLIREGKNGFIIPIQSVNEIKNSVHWFVNNKDKLSKMSQEARATASEYSWEKYEKAVGTNIYNAFKNSQNTDD